MTIPIRFGIWAVLALFAATPIIAYSLPVLNPDPIRPLKLDPTPLEASLSKGYAALNRNELVAAATEFSEAAKLDAKSPLPYMGLAEVAQRRGEPELVEVWLKKALAVAPNNPEPWRSWGRYQVATGKFADAEETLKKAIALAPKAPLGYLDLAENYLHGLLKPKEAASAFREAIKIQPNHVGAHMGLASVLAIQGQAAQALAEYNLAVKLAPDSPLPNHQLGLFYAAQKKYDNALTAFSKSLQIRADYAPAQLDRGDVYFIKGAYDKALADYQVVAKTEPKLAALAHFKSGALLQSQKKWAEAEQAFLKAVEADPKMFGAYNNLAWMAVERKEHLQEALVWAKKAVEIAPESGDTQDTLGWVYHARGELAQATTALEKAVAKQPRRTDFYYHLGVVYAEKGQRNEAVATFKKALEIAKDFPEAADTRRQLEKLGVK